MEDLRSGRATSRRYRNRRIGEFLKELGLAEGRSTGIPEILRAMRGNDSPAPVFESDDDRTWFLTRLPVHERLRSQSSERITVRDIGRVATRLEQLVNALTGDMSRAELQAALKIRNLPHFVGAILRPALEAGLIEMTLPDTPDQQESALSPDCCRRGSRTPHQWGGFLRMNTVPVPLRMRRSGSGESLPHGRSVVQSAG